MKRLSSGRSRAAYLLVFLVILIAASMSCAGPQGPAGASGPPGPQGPTGPAATAAPAAARSIAAMVVANPVASSDNKTVTVYVSGFAPNQRVLVKLQGKWSVKADTTTFDAVDPALGSGSTNAYGAAKIIVPNWNLNVNTYKLQPGVFNLIAEQGDTVVSAPIELIVVKKPAATPVATPKPTVTATPKPTATTPAK